MKVGSGGGEVVGENTAVSGELGGVAVAAGIVGWAGVQEHEARRAGADRRLVVGIGDTVGWEGGEGDGVLVVDVEVGKAVADVGVAAAASRIGYHHNRSSRTKQTAQLEDAVAGSAEAGSIASCKFRNQVAGRGCGLQQRTSRENNPSGAGVEGEDLEVEVAVADCTMAAKKDFFA